MGHGRLIAGSLWLLLLLGPVDAAWAREPSKPVSKVPEAQVHIDRAWDALDQEMRVADLDVAIEELQKAAALDPDNPEILVELADECFQRGDQMPQGTKAERDARRAYFQKGYAKAQQALKLRETAGAHYWMAVNLAAENEDSGIFAQARIFPELNRHAKWIEEHDRDYRYGAIARFWSGVFTHVPGIVVKMVGEHPDRIFAALQEAIQAEPRFVDNYVYKALFYRHMGKPEEALDALAAGLKVAPDAFPGERAYNRYAQRKSRELWKEWTGKTYPDR